MPSRLAKAASVPLIVALPVLSNGSISFIIGPRFTVKELKNNTTTTTRKIIFFLDDQLKNDYRLWSSLEGDLLLVEKSGLEPPTSRVTI